MTNTTINALNDFFQSLDDADLVAIHNEHCQLTNHYDDMIYSMGEFEEYYSGCDAHAVALRVYFGHDELRDGSSFNPMRDWFYIDGEGNPVSIDYVGYSDILDKFMCDCVDVDAIIDYITDNDYDFNYTEIRDILDADGEYIKLNDEPIEIEYVEDEHDEERDFQPSFWLAAAGYNRRFYLDDFTRTHNNPWMSGDWPENIHAVQTDEYHNPLYIELIGDTAVNVYEAQR